MTREQANLGIGTNFHSSENMRILVTGGLGFIGSNLARKLVDYGSHVTLVDSLVPEYGGNLFNISGIEDRVHVNISDVRDEYSMRYLVRGQDLLFNLAGQTSHADSMQDPFTDLEINCRAQLTILRAKGQPCHRLSGELPASPRRGSPPVTRTSCSA
jgi:UDP-glucose 4-epimerase